MCKTSGVGVCVIVSLWSGKCVCGRDRHQLLSGHSSATSAETPHPFLHTVCLNRHHVLTQTQIRHKITARGCVLHIYIYIYMYFQTRRLLVVLLYKY